MKTSMRSHSFPHPFRMVAYVNEARSLYTKSCRDLFRVSKTASNIARRKGGARLENSGTTWTFKLSVSEV